MTLFRTSLVLACLLVSSQTWGADLSPIVKAPQSFGIYPYTGSGFYKGITTFAEIDDSKVSVPGSSAGLFQAGAAAGFTVGYQFANPPGTTFTAIEGGCAYHNTGGTQRGTAVSLATHWSCSQLAKFGGPIANVLNWLPSGLQFPGLPNLGNQTGPTHPYIAAGVRERYDEGSIPGQVHKTWHVDPFLGAGFLTQFSTNIVGDVRLEWAPKGSKFTIGTPVDANTGQSFRLVGSLFF